MAHLRIPGTFCEQHIHPVQRECVYLEMFQDVRISLEIRPSEVALSPRAHPLKNRRKHIERRDRQQRIIITTTTTTTTAIVVATMTIVATTVAVVAIASGDIHTREALHGTQPSRSSRALLPSQP